MDTNVSNTIPIQTHRAGWRQGWILVLTGFLPVMAILALAPTLPTLLGHFRDIPAPQLLVPLLVTAPSLCIALFAPVAGAVADRFGRRNLMLAAMGLYGIGGIVPFVVDNFWAVLAGRFVIGVGEAAIITVTNTLLADYFEESLRHRWLMIQGITGTVLGSSIIAASGFLAAQGWQWPFAVYVVAFPILLAGFAYLYEPQVRAPDASLAVPPRTSNVGTFPWPITLMLCAVTVVLSTIYFVQIINFSLVLKDLGVADPKAVGLIMAVPSLGVPLGSVIFRLTTRFGPKAQICLVLVCYAVGLTGIGMAHDFRVAIAFAFVQQVANGVIVPALIAWGQSLFKFEHRGRGMGMWASAFFVAQFISPAVVNVVRSQAGSLQAAFVAFGVFSLLCAAVAAWARRREAGAIGVRAA